MLGFFFRIFVTLTKELTDFTSTIIFSPPVNDLFRPSYLSVDGLSERNAGRVHLSDVRFGADPSLDLLHK